MTEREGAPERRPADGPASEATPTGDAAPPTAAPPAPPAPLAPAAWTPAPPPPSAPGSAPVPPPMPPAQPLVGWAPPPTAAPTFPDGYEGGPPPYTIGALLSDTFARYGADPLRLFVLAAIASVLSYASSFMGGNPFAPRPSGFVDLTGLVGLLGFVAGILTGSITLALLEGGPRMPFARIIRRGVERAGWMFLTAIVLGLGAVVAFLIAAIPLVILAIASPAAAVVLFIAVALVFVWFYLRVGLSIVANVVDNLNTVDAIKLSWRVTRSAGTWLRVLACSLLLGLIVLPASLLALVVFFVGYVTNPLLFVAAGLLLGVLAPLSSILLYSAYRRLVPPIQPHWAADAPGAAVPAMPAPVPDAAVAEAPPAEPAPPPPPPGAADAVPPYSPEPEIPPLAPLAAPASTPPPATAGWAAPAPSITAPGFAGPAVAAPPRPVFRAPRFDDGAKFIVAVVLLLGVVGIGSFGWLVGEVIAGRVDLPTFPTSPTGPGLPGFPSVDGSVAPGSVAFGTSADISNCTVQAQTVFADSTMDVYWLAAFSRRTTVDDAITFRVTLDGTEIINIQESRGVYDCIGTDVPEVDLTPGLYTFEFYLNGTLDASGTLIVA